MNRLFLMLLMALLSTMAVWAQDWRYDEENELYFNCALIASLKTDFGEESILKFADDDRMTVVEFFDWSFETCAEMDSGDTVGTLNEVAAVSESEPDVVAVLEDGDIHVFDEADCNVMLTDRFESNLNLSFVGMRLANMSAELYLPGAIEPIDMAHTDEYVIELNTLDLPVRNEWTVGDSFPLGAYILDVHIDGETYRLQWMREDSDVNTAVVTCVGHSAEFEFEYSGDVIAVLDDGEEFTLVDLGCSVQVADRFEEDLYVSLAGHRREESSVDVYLPGESEKIDLPNARHEEINVYGIETPIRNEWVEGDSFPLGLYRFDVHIGDSTYRFEWQREDEAVNTIIVSCLELQAEGDFKVEVTAELTDGELYPLEESGCHVGTIDLEAEFFSTVVSGPDRDDMRVEVTYPQMETAVQMQHVESFVADDGRPMRIEWVEAPNFPTGAYLISVTMNERTRHFRWHRQDDAFRTIVLSCDPVASE